MVTQTQISDFRAQGAVLLKGVLNDHIDEARQAIEQNIATPSWRERTYRPEDGTAPFFQDYVVWNQFDQSCESTKAAYPQTENASRTEILRATHTDYAASIGGRRKTTPPSNGVIFI